VITGTSSPARIHNEGLDLGQLVALDQGGGLDVEAGTITAQISGA
jgi:hypothetical protein